MDKRGYHTGHIYFRYLLEKYKVKGEEATDRILKDMETNEIRDHVREKIWKYDQEGSSEKPAEGISDLQKISEGSLNMMIGSRGGRMNSAKKNGNIILDFSHIYPENIEKEIKGSAGST